MRDPEGDLSELEREDLGRHLRQCEPCRGVVSEERGFDRYLRRHLLLDPAPPGLKERIRARVRKSSDVRAGSRRRTAWGVMSAAAASAIVLALLALLPRAAGGPAQTLVGRLVCVACAERGVEMARQRLCRPAEGGHQTGLLTADGTLWRFQSDGAVPSPLLDPSLRGRPVEVVAHTQPHLRTLRIDSARLL